MEILSLIIIIVIFLLVLFVDIYRSCYNRTISKLSSFSGQYYLNNQSVFPLWFRFCKFNIIIYFICFLYFSASGLGSVALIVIFSGLIVLHFGYLIPLTNDRNNLNRAKISQKKTRIFQKQKRIKF